ncbi:hypothetical protein RI129_010255 [Pyrocoelia pectoralis]|uniref:Uncharacterized protein n=1 Tax=Pyrocoelia pectoralis TaxID=417401 RepID=A0AAN7ZJS7_9COLE
MDESKWVIIIPEKLLKAINLWPEDRNIFTTLTFLIVSLILILLEMGQILYLLKNIKDIATMAATMSTISTTFQAICKSSIIFFNHKKLHFMLRTIREDFWSSKSAQSETKEVLKNNGRVVAASMIMVLVSAYVFAVGFLSKPLREGSRELPLISWYPLDWTVTPIYEIIYFLQCVGDMYLAIIGICGHDNIFLAICLNCVAQFMILKDVVTTAGEEEPNREVYVLCIQHHTETTDIVHLISYCLGHILQLFLCCAAADELSYQSQMLANCAYGASWYRKKDLMMMLIVSQKQKKISALGIVKLNYTTFISVNHNI